MGAAISKLDPTTSKQQQQPGFKQELLEQRARVRYMSLLAAPAFLCAVAYFCYQSHTFNINEYRKKDQLTDRLFKDMKISENLVSLCNQVQLDMEGCGGLRSLGVFPRNKGTFNVITSGSGSQGLKRVGVVWGRLNKDDTAVTGYGFDVDQKPLLVFLCTGLEPIHHGHRTLQYGCSLGLPSFLDFVDITDVPKKLQTLFDKNDALNSLMLSDKGKKFVIAREIRYLESSPNYVMTALAVVSFPCFTAVAVLTSRVRFLWKLLLAPAVFQAYHLAKIFADNIKDKNMDDQVMSISDEYSEGALEFYQKEMSRRSFLEEKYGNFAPAEVTMSDDDRSYWGLLKDAADDYFTKSRNDVRRRLENVQSLRSKLSEMPAKSEVLNKSPEAVTS